MGKKNKKDQINKITKKEIFLLDKVSLNKGGLFSAILLIIFLLIFYKVDFIDGLKPYGIDKLAYVGKNHQISLTENALWNPNVFCGIPEYLSTNSPAVHVDTIISSLSKVMLDWKFYWFLLGAVGIFLLINALGMPWYVAAVGAFAFLFWPHFQALIEVGHNTKIRALMVMPLILFTFINFARKRTLLTLAFFAALLALQFRTKHYQIIFYTLILIMSVGIQFIITWYKENNKALILKVLTIFIIGFIYVIIMSAHPLFIAKEYAPHSTRGGQAIDLTKPEEMQSKSAKSGGVTLDYATRWSFSPAEMMTLIIPRFFGGTSSEVYDGDKYPHLHGRQLPTYWGNMPFTQSSEYMGVLLVILAIFGLWINRHNNMIRALFVLLIVTLLLSFGRHFPLLYKPLFNYLPYFNKFRAPMMILTLDFFLVLIFSMYGLRAILEDVSKKNLYILLGIA
ncbi:hypothetical protein KAJ27_04130, partial [bacterium]|nr:hypothetical protein [bacterium]